MITRHALCRGAMSSGRRILQMVFDEGQRLYGSQRFCDAAKSWGQALMLQHAASHAFLSDMLIEGRPDVPKDKKRAFKLAAAGAAMGCAHSKGALGRCLVIGAGVAKDVGKGLALARESAAAGSCFGQFVVGWCCDEGVGVAQDYAEAVRLYRLAAAQGNTSAQNNLGLMFFTVKVACCEMLSSCREGIVRQPGARQQLRAECSQRFEAAAAAE